MMWTGQFFAGVSVFGQAIMSENFEDIEANF